VKKPFSSGNVSHTVAHFHDAAIVHAIARRSIAVDGISALSHAWIYYAAAMLRVCRCAESYSGHKHIDDRQSCCWPDLVSLIVNTGSSGTQRFLHDSSKRAKQTI